MRKTHCGLGLSKAMSSQTKFIISLITDFLHEGNAVGLIYLQFRKGFGLLLLAKWFSEV